MIRTPLKRTGMRRKPSKHPRMPPDVHEAVRRRSRGICELCGRSPGTQHHHRKRAGRLDTEENILLLCAHDHHEVIHAHVNWAYRHGLLVLSTAEPADVPVVTGCGLTCERDHC